MLYAIKFAETKTNSGKFVRPTFLNNHPDLFWPDTPEAMALLKNAKDFLKLQGVICMYTKITGNLLETYQCYNNPEQAQAVLTIKKNICNFIHIYDADIETQEIANYLEKQFFLYSQFRFSVSKKMYGVYEVTQYPNMYELTEADLESFTRYEI